MWLAFPEPFRQHLTPCLELTPELVLTQRRVEVLGPPLKDDPASAAWLDERDEAVARFADRIYACRDELGLESDPEPAALRCDNFGLHGGHVVAIDYGDQFPPLLAVWAWLLDRLRGGPLNIDAERERFDAYVASGKPIADLGVKRPTFRSLAERAGLNAENTDACPCFCGGTFSDGDPFRCLLDTDAAELLAERTLSADQSLERIAV